jgi:hypothetical protein
MLLVLLIRMRLLRMRNGDGIYRGGKLLGNRLVVSVCERIEKSERVYLEVSLSEARKATSIALELRVRSRMTEKRDVVQEIDLKRGQRDWTYG